MTELLFLTDAYVSEFDATVTEVTDDGGVILDRTAFYIGGGGQPCDVGALTDASGVEFRVTKASRSGGSIVHAIDGSDRPAVGAAVHGAIDWERRYRLMRTHTALHILCGVVWAGLRGAGHGRRHAARARANGFRAGKHVGRVRRRGGSAHQR